jgi:hypothetical protein
LELLLSACLTYDKKITNPGKQQRAGYQVIMGVDQPDSPYDINNDLDYEAYQIDTDISDIFVHSTNMN